MAALLTIIDAVTYCAVMAVIGIAIYSLQAFIFLRVSDFITSVNKKDAE
jgi:hypothetical protein